jgi:hypothetical protein
MDRDHTILIPGGQNYWYKDVKLIYGYMANLKCQWRLLSVIIGFSYGKETIYLNFQEERCFLLIYVGFQYAIGFFGETPYQVVFYCSILICIDFA